jgi:phosphoglucosamine mutase
VSRLFGTDGIRGVANEAPLTPDLAFRLGRELVATLAAERGNDRPRLVIGRDTRRSGPLLECALVAGVLSAGGDVFSVGVLPTPAIALLTKALEAGGGIALSASHNPFPDNGIKLFSAEGTKLLDAWEDEIEARLAAADRAPRARRDAIGRLVSYDRAEAYYVDYLARCFPLDLGGMTVALDCAHGATCRVAPRLFRRLGARVVAIGVKPTGLNINAGFGALHPETLQDRVRRVGANIGFAFDGDGDRLVSVDATGTIRDGDYALAIIGRHLGAKQRLRNNVIVTTVMANLGLDEALTGAGIAVVKTQVGDRYVSEEMQRVGANVGGEQSGHLLFLDHAPTGDGILSALALLSVVLDAGEPLESLAACMRKFPQVLVNVPVASKPPLDEVPGLMARVAEFERELDGTGRIVLRYSGTEPLARVMIEGAAEERIRGMADDLARLIRERLAAGAGATG